MDSQRRQILGMIEAGQITAAEGAKLLEALEGPERSRWVQVQVTDLRRGREVVRVKLPLRVVELAARLSLSFADLWDVPVAVRWHAILQATSAASEGKIIDLVDEATQYRVQIGLD